MRVNDLAVFYTQRDENNRAEVICSPLNTMFSDCTIVENSVFEITSAAGTYQFSGGVEKNISEMLNANDECYLVFAGESFSLRITEKNDYYRHLPTMRDAVFALLAYSV